MPEQPSRESLLDLIEELKLGLVAQATGRGVLEPDRYRQIRKHILGVPSLKEHIPRFLRVCRDTDSFWTYIQPKFAHYSERRTFLDDSFAPLLEVLEGTESTIEDHFEFGDLIGQGGFGSVYRVRHRLLEMDFAVKVLDPAFDDGNAADLDRFFREARVLLSLNHPNVIRIFDVGLTEGRPFIRMEFIEGQNLNQTLQTHGRLTAEESSCLAEEILEGLVHAHDQARVVHRDLKPSNIMISSADRVKIVDFGLGVFLEGELLSRITRTGEAAVGGYYTAPELVAEPRTVDPRTDLYSVGAMWFTALVGEPPAGTNIERLLISNGIPANYRDTLLRSLADIDTRFQSAHDMLMATRALAR